VVWTTSVWVVVAAVVAADTMGAADVVDGVDVFAWEVATAAALLAGVVTCSVTSTRLVFWWNEVAPTRCVLVAPNGDRIIQRMSERSRDPQYFFFALLS
jgi:hypothetical protein